MATAPIVLIPKAWTPDGTSPPGGNVEGDWEWLFDPDADEIVLIRFRMPVNYASDPVLKIQYKMASVQTGTNNVCWGVQCRAVAVGQDLDVEAFDTANYGSDELAENQAAGLLSELSLSLTNNDNVAAEEMFELKLFRDADATGGTDDATGDAEFVAAELDYTTT